MTKNFFIGLIIGLAITFILIAGYIKAQGLIEQAMLMSNFTTFTNNDELENNPTPNNMTLNDVVDRLDQIINLLSR